MKKEVLEYVTEKTKELISAPSCCQEARDAAKNWLDAVGTDKEEEATKSYLAELEEDIIPIDGLIAFFSSEAAVQHFGAEKASSIAAHGRELKAAGAKYCDCPACAAVGAILEKKEELLK